MNAEEFLRKQFRARMDANKKIKAQPELFKVKMEDYCILLWKRTHHRGEDAIRAALEYTKKTMNKGATCD